MNNLEVEYLECVKENICNSLDILNSALNVSQNDIVEMKKYIWENIYELDPLEITSNRQSVSQELFKAEMQAKRIQQLIKMKENPYFARIVFKYTNSTNIDEERYYIGLGGYTAEGELTPMIYDWRAPISSLYYDFDVGHAAFKAPSGMITGQILSKRQYRIRNGKLEFFLDSDVKIDDEILQKELSQNSNQKMKTIVSTIQREQNSIIRNENDEVLIVQGVAGSGKTSIALHRIAYLLYRNREQIKSSNILVVSPNRIFSDFISNVLPELGEENIIEMNFEDIARNELPSTYRFESRFQFLSDILTNKKSESDVEHFKNSPEFIIQLREYCKFFMTHHIRMKSISISDVLFKKEHLEDLLFSRFAEYPIFLGIRKLSENIADYLEYNHNYKVNNVIRKQIYDNLLKFVSLTKLVDIYNDFIRWLMGKGCIILSPIGTRNIPHTDVFPIILLKHYLFGISKFNNIKHLVIDEMQEYSVVQYEIIKSMFNCKMTILGDISQMIGQNPIDVALRFSFPNAAYIKLNKSYRSTLEITQYANRIIKNDTIIPFKRHGEKPKFSLCKTMDEMIHQIADFIKSLSRFDYKSVGIICKTEGEAKVIYDKLKRIIPITLINRESESFSDGTIITSSYLAKGLEYDVVIIPNADKDNYKNYTDKQALYVACTRALHVLHLYSFKPVFNN